MCGYVLYAVLSVQCDLQFCLECTNERGKEALCSELAHQPSCGSHNVHISKGLAVNIKLSLLILRHTIIG